MTMTMAFIWQLWFLMITSWSSCAADTIGIWPMSIANGRDVSEYHNHGKPNMELIYYGGINGPNTAVYFPGSGRHIHIPKLNGLTGGSFSVGAYINMVNHPLKTPVPFFGLLSSTGTTLFVIEITNDLKLSHRFPAKGSSGETTFAVKKEAWAFVGMSYNSKTGFTRMWIDDTVSEISQRTDLLSGVTNAVIGAGNTDKDWGINFKEGVISCVVLYNTDTADKAIIQARQTCALYGNSAVFSKTGAGIPPASVMTKSIQAVSTFECTSKCLRETTCQSCSFSDAAKMCVLASQALKSSSLTPSGDYKSYNFGA